MDTGKTWPAVVLLSKISRQETSTVDNLCLLGNVVLLSRCNTPESTVMRSMTSLLGGPASLFGFFYRISVND